MVNSRKSVVRNSGISSHKNKLNLSNTLRKGFLRKGGALTKRRFTRVGGMKEAAAAPSMPQFQLKNPDGTCLVDPNYHYVANLKLTDSYKFGHYRQYPVMYNLLEVEGYGEEMLTAIKDDTKSVGLADYLRKAHSYKNYKKGGYTISYFEPRKYKEFLLPTKNNKWQQIVKNNKFDLGGKPKTQVDFDNDKDIKDEDNSRMFFELNNFIAEKSVVHYGLQYFIRKFLSSHSFIPPLELDIKKEKDKGNTNPTLYNLQDEENRSALNNYRTNYMSQIRDWISQGGIAGLDEVDGSTPSHLYAAHVFNEEDWLAIAAGSDWYGPRYDDEGSGEENFAKLFDLPSGDYKITKPGYLPIMIESVPEGTVLTVSNMLFKIVNTHPRFYWLPNYLETLFVEVWYPMTIASTSRIQRNIIAAYRNVDMGGALAGAIDDAGLVDFGFRGVSSLETATLGSSAYLCSGGKASDTCVGARLLQSFYSTRLDGHDEYLAGDKTIGNIAQEPVASEHSTITSWSEVNNTPVEHYINEQTAFLNMINVYTGNNIVISTVVDGYNVWNALWNQHWSPLAILTIENFFKTGLFITFRPDSGDGIESMVHIAELLFIRMIHYVKHMCQLGVIVKTPEIIAAINYFTQQDPKYKAIFEVIAPAVAPAVASAAAPAAAAGGVKKNKTTSLKKKNHKNKLSMKGGASLNEVVKLNSNGFLEALYPSEPVKNTPKDNLLHQNNLIYAPFEHFTHPNQEVILDEKTSAKAGIFAGGVVPTKVGEIFGKCTKFNDLCMDVVVHNFNVLYTQKGKKTLTHQPDDVYGFNVLQGDAVELSSLPNYLSSVAAHGWDTNRFIFGSGGGLLQKVNRDSLNCAFKCSGCILPPRSINESQAKHETLNIQKRPLTDGMKKSKPGNLVVYSKSCNEMVSADRPELTPLQFETRQKMYTNSSNGGCNTDIKVGATDVLGLGGNNPSGNHAINYKTVYKTGTKEELVAAKFTKRVSHPVLINHNGPYNGIDGTNYNQIRENCATSKEELNGYIKYFVEPMTELYNKASKTEPKHQHDTPEKILLRINEAKLGSYWFHKSIYVNQDNVLDGIPQASKEQIESLEKLNDLSTTVKVKSAVAEL